MINEKPVHTAETSAMKKVSARVMPLVFLLYLIAFIDRANVSYAKLTMLANLGFSEAVYGLGAGLFFAGYVLLEIPGGLIVQRWGARLWMTRIMITWGLCTSLVGMSRTAHEFYATRFLLGVAEGGFFPGIVVYLNEWFPPKYRASALARYVMAGPIALALGGPLAGLILKAQWMGLPGWRWVFILEGVPALAVGVTLPFVMTDRPQQACWLTQNEQEWIIQELAEEKRLKAHSSKITTWSVLYHPAILLLSAVTFIANIGIAGFFLWLPSRVQQASGFSAYLSSAVSGLPFLAAVAGQLFFGWSSDRMQERVWHTAIPLALAGILFPITAYPYLPFTGVLFWLCASSAMIFGFGPPYWTLPALIIGDTPAAAGLGLVNAFSGLGGFVGPTIVGAVLTAGYPFLVAVIFLSACFLGASALTMSLLRLVRRHGG
jgi:MFS transporter, ACS family, tartrate transporter